MEPDRAFTIQTIQLIADLDAQVQYKRDVPIADVPSELVCSWFDDVYHPEYEKYCAAFTQEELDVLSEFNAFYDERVNKLPDTLEEMHDNYEWSQIVLKAKWVLAKLNWKDINAVPTYNS